MSNLLFILVCHCVNVILTEVEVVRCFKKEKTKYQKESEFLIVVLTTGFEKEADSIGVKI